MYLKSRSVLGTRQCLQGGLRCPAMEGSDAGVGNLVVSESGDLPVLLSHSLIPAECSKCAAWEARRLREPGTNPW